MGDMSGYYLPQQAAVPPQQPPQHDIHTSVYSHYPHPPTRFSYFEPPLHHQHQHQHHTLLSPQSPPSRASLESDVRTLFIAGLPANVKNREIYHLFREFPGFLSTNLRPPSGNSQGMVFDLEEGSTLYIDLAKSNSRSKRHGTGNERSGSGKKHKASQAFPKDSFESGIMPCAPPWTEDHLFCFILIRSYVLEPCDILWKFG
ncbi:hypothetical protein KSS87_006537 [Heliosperma pusillum]|nr:hypothetical protein KSS87_006537 [Heliosperma pusillum]